MKTVTHIGLFFFIVAGFAAQCSFGKENFSYPKNLSQARAGEWATYKIDTIARDGEKTSNIIRRTLLSKTDKSATFRIETLNPDGSVKDTLGSEIDLQPQKSASNPAPPSASHDEEGNMEIKVGDKTYSCRWRKTRRTARPANQDIEFESVEYYSPDAMLDGLVKREKKDSLGLNSVMILVECGINRP